MTEDLDDDFDWEPPPDAGSGDAGAEPEAPPEPPPLLSDSADQALGQLGRRVAGRERPIPVPWPNVEAVLGGGLWPGLFVLVALTGLGKTQMLLSMLLHAARHEVPVLYVSLELSLFDIHARVWGLMSDRFSWTDFLFGGRGQDATTRAEIEKEAQGFAATLCDLPFHVIEAPLGTWGAAEMGTAAAGMRERYPLATDEEGKALDGSNPFAMGVDFLQLVGPYADENGRYKDTRVRVGEASYAGREIARKFGASVILVSSAARANYGLLGGQCSEAGLQVDGRIKTPDVLVGMGKESGEIEFSADGVIVAVRFPSSTRNSPIAFTVPKLRAGPPAWTALEFNGHQFSAGNSGLMQKIVSALEDKKESRGRSTSKAKKPPSAPTVDADGDDDDLPW